MDLWFPIQNLPTKNPWAVASSGEEAGAVAKEVLQLGRAPSEAEKVEGT